MVAYRRLPSRSRTKGGPYTGANTVLRPPISTDLAGFRACWIKLDGAVFINSRQRPFGKWTRSPLTSAPASFHISSASASSRNSIPTSSSRISALASINAAPSSSSRSTGGIARFTTGRLGRVNFPLICLRLAAPPLARLLRVLAGVFSELLSVAPMVTFSTYVG